MNTATLRKDSIPVGLLYRFRALILYCHGGKQGRAQADTVQEKEPIALHLCICRQVKETLGLFGAPGTSKPIPCDTLSPTNTHPLQQGHLS